VVSFKNLPINEESRIAKKITSLKAKEALMEKQKKDQVA
jgi:hypothetical protein